MSVFHPGWRAFFFSALCLSFWTFAHAAELDGVQMPDTLQVDGKALHMNGIGLRTYSIFAIHIYVAALYVEHLSTDPETIISSLETKALLVKFEHDVDAEAARKAWKDGLENNCQAPCHLDLDDMQRFLAEVPAMSVGDTYLVVFTRRGAVVSVNGREIGAISHRQFAEAMLATFLGPKPATERLKQALLAGHA
jgi:hypothetical protein